MGILESTLRKDMDKQKLNGVADKSTTTVCNGVVEKSTGTSFDEGDALGSSGLAMHELVASMPVVRRAAYYKMDHQKRGIAVIFNHEHFDIPNLKSRAGTNVDCLNLKNTLEKIGFDVMVYDNLRVKVVMETVRAIANMDHGEHDCLLVAILSHGEMGVIYAKDVQYKLEDVWSNFTADKCPSLAGKPKVFLVQACQGDRLDGGVTLENRNGLDSRTETDGNEVHSYRIPTHADFLIAYSTIPGFYSWRNTTHGSWFMQALCTELQTHGFIYDILTILTFVAQRVAIDFESNTPDNYMMHRQKQIPCVTSMLTRLLRFEKK